jgi:hypothetical protein
MPQARQRQHALRHDHITPPRKGNCWSQFGLGNMARLRRAEAGEHVISRNYTIMKAWVNVQAVEVDPSEEFRQSSELSIARKEELAQYGSHGGRCEQELYRRPVSQFVRVFTVCG